MYATSIVITPSRKELKGNDRTEAASSQLINAKDNILKGRSRNRTNKRRNRIGGKDVPSDIGEFFRERG